MPALRKVIHPQAHRNYRVIWKDDGAEIEIGSIGIQHGSGATEYWAWDINAVLNASGSIFRADYQGTRYTGSTGLSHKRKARDRSPAPYRRRLSGTLSGGGF